MTRVAQGFLKMLFAVALVILSACDTKKPPIPDFSLAFNPLSISLAAGATGNSTLSLTPIAGFDTSQDPTAFSIEGSAFGTAVTQIQVSDFAKIDNTHGTFSFTAGTSIPAGAYDLTFKFTIAGIQRSTKITINVTTTNNSVPNPTNLTATVISSSQLDLSWDAVTDATGYVVEKKVGAVFQALVTVQTEAAQITGLNPNTLYTFRVKTVIAGNSSSGVETSATTQAGVTSPPQITSLPFLSASGVVTTITGSNFGITQGNSSVSFGGSGATQVVSWTDTEIKVIVPSQASVGAAIVVEVTTTGGTGNLSARVIRPVTLAAGLAHSLALKPDGGVVAWGANDKGQTTIPVSAQSGVVSIAANGLFGLALKSDGSVVGWGGNGSGQTTIPASAKLEVMAIAAGDGHSLALKTDGSVVAWGYNYNGQATVPVGAQTGVVAVTAGGSYSLALKSDGSVVAWGYFQGNPLPSSVSSGVVSLETGTSHALAIKSDGSVIGWGDNTNGRITIPAAASSGVVAISAGFDHSLVVKNDGTLLAFGANATGQITIPSAAQTNVVAVSAGAGFSLALKNDGSVVAWGNNTGNQTNVPANLIVAIP